MNIYFAAAIRSAGPEKAAHQQLIDILKNYGTILTEFVGKDFGANGQEGVDDTEVYESDMANLELADVVIAEVSSPSHGVGFEIARAQSMDKPILCLCNPKLNPSLSALLQGNPNIIVAHYETIDEAGEVIEEFFQQ